MCCNEAPEAPDMAANAAASKYAADLAFEQQQLQIDWAREQWTDQKALLDQTLGVQTGIMQEQWEAGKADRQRYEQIYQGLEDDLVKEFQEYGSDERIALEQGRAQAAVQQSFDAQRQNAQRNLEAYGIDPSQTRSQAIDSNARIQMAAQQAAAGNQARYRVEDMGRSLRAEALSIGKGYPSQVAQSYGQALNAGNSAVGNMNSTVASGASTMGTGQSWGSQGLQANMQNANIQNMGFQNELSAYEAGGGAMGGMGQVVGMAGGIAGSMGYAEGGEVPGDAALPRPGVDKYPALLAEGEYIIPADVVSFKGTEFFDKLKEKARGIPTGAQNGTA